MLAIALTVSVHAQAGPLDPDCGIPPRGSIRSEEVVNGSFWKSYRVRVPAGGAVAFSMDSTTGIEGSRSIFYEHLQKIQNGAVTFDYQSSFTIIGDELINIRKEPVPYTEGSVTVREALLHGAACTWTQISTDTEAEFTGTVFRAIDSETSSVAFRLWATTGSTVVSESGGDSAYLFTESDFSGGSSQIINVLGMRQTEIADSSLSLDISGRAFGFFASTSDSSLIGYDGPAGSHDGARRYFLKGLDPGSYLFRIDNDQNGYITLGIADVDPA